MSDTRLPAIILPGFLGAGKTVVPHSRFQQPATVFDALPALLRQWLSQAMLPWPLASARRLSSKSLINGLEVKDALALLTKAEARTIAHDRHFTVSKLIS